MNRQRTNSECVQVDFLNAQRWTALSIHPQVRRLADSDDEHFTGYKGVTIRLEYPREFYGVIGSHDCPLRLVSPGDWVVYTADGRCTSMSEERIREHYTGGKI